MNANKHNRPAFTLVELLVVVAIISVLAALITVVGRQAIINAQEASIALEISDLEQAVASYKAQNKGSYPPDFTTLKGFQKHLQRAYPKMKAGEITNFLADPNQDGDKSDKITTFDQLDPSQALVFFLGGGLYDNAEYPLTGGADPSATPKVPPRGKRRIFYEFDERRLFDFKSNGFPSYLPRFGKQTPYVYFDSRNYENPNALYPKKNPPLDPTDSTDKDTIDDIVLNGTGFVRPYLSTFLIPGSSPAKNKWENEKKFQIISAGIDAHFGNYTPTNFTENKIFPDVTEFSVGKKDRDNIADFSDGKTFEDRLP